MMLCDLLSIKRISGRPSSAPKLAMDTEFISGASRALAAMTLVRQAAASEIAVPSGIRTREMDRWRRSILLHGRITVVIMACCILTGLVSVWWEVGRVAETVSTGTQILEEGDALQTFRRES